MKSKFSKIIIAFSLTIIFITSNSMGIKAHEEYGTSTVYFPPMDYTILKEEYIDVEEWDGVNPPIINGERMNDGWFKYNDRYSKVKDGEIVIKEDVMPTNFNGDNGLGNLEIVLSVEEQFKEDVGFHIISKEQGVETTKILSEFANYRVYLRDLPAGNYSIEKIYDPHSKEKSDISYKFDYPLSFSILNEVTEVIEIHTKEYFEETGQVEKAEKMEELVEKREEVKQKEEALNKEKTEIEKIAIKEEDIVKKKTIWPTVIGGVVILLLGLLGYKAYKHII